MEAKIHELKINAKFASLHFEGKKHWEIRFDDRDFKVGDFIRFTIIESGMTYLREICNVFSEIGLQRNFVILSLKVLPDDVEILCKYGLDEVLQMDTFLHGFKSNKIEISCGSFIERFRIFEPAMKISSRKIMKLLFSNPHFEAKRVIATEGSNKIRSIHIQKLITK